ncbi:MAG: YraN family protein [Candidatus Firestonebacteria bacterium]
MVWKKSLGDFGETAAVEFLKKQGFLIIERNYRCRYGEIDIIAKEKAVISFVEVKTITKGSTESPVDTITPAKQKHIQRCAELYLAGTKEEYDCRFDVVAIEYEKGSELKIELIRDAF